MHFSPLKIQYSAQKFSAHLDYTANKRDPPKDQLIMESFQQLNAQTSL